MKITLTQFEAATIIREKYGASSVTEVVIEVTDGITLVKFVDQLKEKFPKYLKERKIAAIKWVREITHCGLADAKFFVEAIPNFNRSELETGSITVTGPQFNYKFSSNGESIAVKVIHK